MTLVRYKNAKKSLSRIFQHDLYMREYNIIIINENSYLINMSSSRIKFIIIVIQ